jgi:hypothetical protein
MTGKFYGSYHRLAANIAISMIHEWRIRVSIVKEDLKLERCYTVEVRIVEELNSLQIHANRAKRSNLLLY